MIEKWTVRNFKSVYDEITLDFAPLTIFCGANSSGKSTLVQSLLLTAQTVQSPVYSRSVILNGLIARLGTFDDIISNSRQGEQVKIGFRLAITDEDMAARPSGSFRIHRFAGQTAGHLRSVECHFTFSAGRSYQAGHEALRLQPRLETSSVVVTAQAEDQTIREEVSVERCSQSVPDRLRGLKLTPEAAKDVEPGALEFEVVKPTTLRNLRRYYRMPPAMRPAGASLQHFLPERFWGVYDSVEEQSRRLAETLLDRDELYRQELAPSDVKRLFTPEVKAILFPQLREVATALGGMTGTVRVPAMYRERFSSAVENLDTSFDLEHLKHCYQAIGPYRRLLTESLSTRTVELQKAIHGDRPPEYRVAAAPLPEVSETGVSYVQLYFRRLVKYLGPLRDEPKPVYPLAGATDPKDVGYRGEHTAAVLELHRNTRVDYISSSRFAGEGLELTSGKVTLYEAVLDWLRYMGVVEDVRTLERGSLGHELKVSTGTKGPMHDLTHVGVGVSQVLPIVVLSLLAESGSLLIFEQPELHLHPRVQTRLADFFVSMMLLNKQCVLETHSEYFINQLRYRAVTSLNDAVSKKVMIYFVSKAGQSSTFRPIRMNQFGAIDDWPKGFFDENEENAKKILKAAMGKRQQGGAEGHG